MSNACRHAIPMTHIRTAWHSYTPRDMPPMPTVIMFLTSMRRTNKYIEGSIDRLMEQLMWERQNVVSRPEPSDFHLFALITHLKTVCREIFWHHLQLFDCVLDAAENYHDLIITLAAVVIENAKLPFGNETSAAVGAKQVFTKQRKKSPIILRHDERSIHSCLGIF